MDFTARQTDTFAAWHRGLRDLKARIAIARRIDRAAAGNHGDAKTVGEGVSEMRVDVGAGYRVYLVLWNRVMVVLLCGGDKKSQAADIKLAKRLAKEH